MKIANTMQWNIKKLIASRESYQKFSSSIFV